MDSPSKPPSLTAPEATGGENNERGLSFQEIALLSVLPKWLSYDGFTSVIREHFGDFEAKFFAPGIGYVKEFIEAKNHYLAPKEFWHEIGEFRRRAETGQSYRWFRLISTGLSEDLKPLKNGLRRVRDPHSFYEDDQPIAEQAYADFEKIVLDLDKDASMAKFLYEQVLIEDDYSPNLELGQSLFTATANKSLPGYEDLSGKTHTAIYQALSAIIAGRINQEITRHEIETTYQGAIPEGQRPNQKSIHIHTATSGSEAGPETALTFDWNAYFGGASRSYPPPDTWNSGVIKPLNDTLVWARLHRSERRIRLTGQRRLSATIAFGSAFSAVSGFAVEEVYRDSVLWQTDDHPLPDTPPYELTSTPGGPETGAALVVSIGILGSIATEVVAAMPSLELEGLPELHLSSSAPIASSQQANLAARLIKDAIREKLISTHGKAIHGKAIHLFYKGPSPLALFIGHRLNAVNADSIHCYEWTGPATYAPTCILGRP